MPLNRDELKEYPKATDVFVPEVIEPKYPGFSEYNQKKKVDILSTEIAFKDNSLDSVLINLGMTNAEYRELCINTDLLEEVSRKSKARLIEYIPDMYDRLGQDAADGDPMKMKMLLQSTKDIDVEGSVQNQYLLHMDNNQLMKKIEQLKLEASELIDDDAD